MYKLVHTHKKKKKKKNRNSLSLNYATHTFFVSPQYQVCSKSRKRYHPSCNPQEKIKQDSK